MTFIIYSMDLGRIFLGLARNSTDWWRGCTGEDPILQGLWETTELREMRTGWPIGKAALGKENHVTWNYSIEQPMEPQ